MFVVKRGRRAATTLIAAAGVAAAIIPASAQAVTVTNACRNNVTANNSQINVDTSATAPASVAPGASATLTNLQQTANIPGSIFVAGYNLGLGQEGQNNVPADVFTKIEGTNTVEGVQTSSTAHVTVTYTITDPDHSPGTGDESATDGSFTAHYADMTFTAGAGPGPIQFRQDTQTPIAASPEFQEKGTLIIRALVGGFFKVRFGCTPGTVTGPDPGTVAFIDPASPFASTGIVTAPTGLVTGNGTKTPANGKTNTFAINAPDASSGTISFATTGGTYNGVISCVKVVGNAATIVSQGTGVGGKTYLNRAQVLDSPSGDKIINTMINTATASDKTITKYSTCITPDTAALNASVTIATGDIVVGSAPASARHRARRAL